MDRKAGTGVKAQSGNRRVGLVLIVVDCAAASVGGYRLDFGNDSGTIERNLHDYVLAGGSVYASDWGLVFATAAAPGSFAFDTQPAGSVTPPFDATRLMGFAPQTLTATFVDPALSTFLGRASIPVNFPKQTGAVSVHWGLMRAVSGATVLARADSVEVCADVSCSAPGAARDGVPLVARVKLTAEGTRGGTVVYASFHNIAQSSSDVAQLLKYLILTL